MKGACAFNGGVASSGSTSAAEEVVVEKDYVGLSEATSSHPAVEEEAEDAGDEEAELELRLSLGARKVAGGGGGKAAPMAAPWGQCCRILTAKDFPSLVSRALPRSSSTSSVSSSSAALGGGVSGGGGVTGTKRAAESVSPDVVGSGHPPSQVVVGWPPIRAFRMNNLFNQSKDNTSETDAAAHKKTNSSNTNMKEANGNNDQACKGRTAVSSRFVKVKMDGDPIGRKVDLNAHHSYEILAQSLELMFHKPTTALSASAHGVKASKLLDGSSEFALTYEDKDGDWMLVGDVPWGMFLDTVKRLRIMRTSDASGLGPRFQSSDKSGGLARNKP